MLDAVPASPFAWARLTKQKVTKQLISSKKSRFITGAYFNYATSPQMNRMVGSPSDHPGGHLAKK